MSINAALDIARFRFWVGGRTVFGDPQTVAERLNFAYFNGTKRLVQHEDSHGNLRRCFQMLGCNYILLSKFYSLQGGNDYNNLDIVSRPEKILDNEDGRILAYVVGGKSLSSKEEGISRIIVPEQAASSMDPGIDYSGGKRFLEIFTPVYSWG